MLNLLLILCSVLSSQGRGGSVGLEGVGHSSCEKGTSYVNNSVICETLLYQYSLLYSGQSSRRAKILSWNSDSALARSFSREISPWQISGPFELHVLRKERTSKISPNIFHCKFPRWLHEENSCRSSANPVLLIRLPLPQCFWLRGTKLRPWSDNTKGIAGGEWCQVVWVSNESRPKRKFRARKSSYILSGVAPAHPTEESEVRELSGKESGISSRTPFLRGFCIVFTSKRTPFPKVREPHFLRFGLPQPLLILGSLGRLSRLKNFSQALEGLRKTRMSVRIWGVQTLGTAKFTRPQLGPFFVLKFVRSRGFGARFLQPFPKSLVTRKYYQQKNGR